jgi:DNA-binding XRE family transcriptional regulator
MAGHRNFSELRNKMSPERRARSDARVKEMMAEMLLAELRKHSGLTQQEVAETLGISQPGLSKMESQSDMQIGTLDRIVEALGGKLEIIAHMPGGDVVLTQFNKQSA